MIITIKYEFIVYEEEKGFWAECKQLKGCHTQAENLNDLAANAKEALELYLKEGDDE